MLSFTHVIRLADTLVIRDKLPALDRLRGSGLGQGISKHELTARANYRRSGIGATLDARWRSASRSSGGATTLRFSDYSTFDLKLFADLGRIEPLRRAAPWIKGTRLSLDVENLLNGYSHVRDQT